MKASERCKAYYQGDRCQKAKHHESPIMDKPDAVHVGQFTAWKGEDQVVAKSVKTSMKRNRRFNRFLRGVCSKQFNPNLIPHQERASMKYLLQMAVRKLRRIQETQQ